MEDKEKKYKEIISEHQDMIYRLCCSYVMDIDLRKDLFQNILIRIWKGLHTFKYDSKISTWIYRLAVNASIDFIRKEFKSNHKSKKINIDNMEIADHSNNLEDGIIISEKIKFMYTCINNLSFIDKTIITLYMEDLSYQEISQIVGISEKNVSVKLVRIKKNLNACLREY